MADFETCFPFVLSNEDYDPPRYETVPDPTSDKPDAQAISGINSAYWPQDFAQIVTLPLPLRGPAVSSFYERRFWNEWLAQINSNRVAAMILDSSVNQGPGVGVKLAQIAAGLAESEQDGKWGPVTVAAINALPVGEWVPAFVNARAKKYQQTGGPSLVAWLGRAESIPSFA